MSRLASYKGMGAPLLQVEQLSSASTAVNLTPDQQGKFLWFDGGIRQINLPAPEAGMTFMIMNSTGGHTTVTKILSSGESDILTAASTAKGVGNFSTVEAGVIIKVTAINDYRWVASRMGGSTLALAAVTT